MKTPLILLPLAALALSGCGYSVFDAAEDIQGNDNGLANGKAITTQAATVGAFTKVQALGPDDIVFVTGNTFSIKAEGDADVIKRLRYDLKKGAIIIGRTDGKFWDNDEGDVTITITAPTLAEASLAGSGSFTADRMAGDRLMLETAGSGDLKVDAVSGGRLNGKIAGSGDISVAGKVDSADFAVLGSGTIDGQKLAVAVADAMIAGSGDISLNASDKVDAAVAGSGSINVTGGAKCSSKTMGSGSINCS
jgi:hypothetical protein